MTERRFSCARLLICATFFAFCSLATGQATTGTDPRATLTVDRLYGSADFFPEQFGTVRWLEDGSGYTAIESHDRRGPSDLVRYEPATGAREVLVAARNLVPAGQRRPLTIEDYVWSPDGRRLLIYTNSKRVWRDNTRGDYWVHTVGGDTPPRQLGQSFDGGSFEPSRLMFAKFAPQGDRVAYVYRNDIFVEDLATHEIKKLTHDGSDTTINGTFDWVYEEEFHVQDGFRWSPDGTHIAYWQLDATGVGEFYMVDNLSDAYAQIVPVQYPKAGTTNSAARAGVVPAIGGETVWMQLDGDPRNNYIARLDWAGDSDEVVMQYLNRRQDRNRVTLGDADTGETREIFVDKDDAWLDAVDDMLWFDDGARFTWFSERDGWRNVYVVERDGSSHRLITEGDWDAMEIAHIDASADGHVYVIASLDDPAQRFLYRVPFSGGKPERLTPDEAGGTHEYQISPDAKWAIHTYSSFGVPPIVELVSLPDHQTVRTFVDNARLQATMDRVAKGHHEFFRIDADGVELDGWMIQPPDFDPSVQWPVIFFVYGEPWRQTVLDAWGYHNHIWHLQLAQLGYVVMSLDNRGTPAPRGRKWRKSVHGQIGVLSSRDQAAGLDAIAAKWDWVDKDRIGVWGWSGGGSMTLNMLFRHPERYHVGISVAPVPDQLLYDTIYQERYSGIPAENPESYRTGSPITYAKNLTGELLLVHGTADDNVHYQGAERLVDELVAHDKQFRFFAYPGRSHGIFERRNTRRHLFKMMTKFFLEKLPSGRR